MSKMSNMSNMSIESKNRSLYDLGDAMCKYATASWVFLAGSVFVSIISLIEFFSSFYMMDYYYLGISSIFSMQIGVIAFTIIIPIVMIGLAIFLLIRMIQFLVKLNNAAKILQDKNLSLSYKTQLWATILSVCTPFILIILYIGALFFIYGDYYGFGFLIPILVSLGLALALMILKIVSAVALDNWAESLLYRTAPQGNYNLSSIKSGTNSVKIGQILFAVSGIASVTYIGGFLVIIGPIFTNLGYAKAGKNMKEYFGNPENRQYISQTRAPSPPTYQSSTNFQGSNPNYYQATQRPNVYPPQPNYGATQPPTSLELRSCPFCGNSNLVKNSTFCDMCGKKLK